MKSDGTFNGLDYIIKTDFNTVIISYSGTNTSLDIPSVIDGYPVTEIYYGAFQNCTSLVSVTIPDSVTSIGDSAFSGCTPLTSVTIPSSVTSIGYSVFSGCTSLEKVEITDIAAWCGITFYDNPLKYAGTLYVNGEELTDLVIPEGVNAVNAGAFENCAPITSVVFPESLQYVEGSAFKGCVNLGTLTFGKNVSAIRESAFDGCTSLKTVRTGMSELEWYRKVYIGDMNEPLRNAVYNFDVHEESLEHFEAVAAGCTTAGSIEYWKCSVCGRCYTDADGKNEIHPDLIAVSALGHDFGEWTESVAPTCTEKGTDERICSRCFEKETRETEALGHTYDAVGTDPTCTEQGFTTHTCIRCDDFYVDTYVDALGHDFGEWIEIVSPTCAEKGTEERMCSRCGEKETRAIDALGHNYAELVTAPTCTEKGFTTHTCTHCGDAYVDMYVDALGHDFGKDGNAAKCSVCGEKNPNYKPPVEFKDVPSDAFYADAVAWAVAGGITAGTGDGKFSPNDPCTRGQVVTFLWRAAGSPEPTGSKNPFRDVKESDYFYKAVIWAVENGVTSGTSATTFSPNATCTRGQIVTFQWRANKSPEPKSSSNPFVDVRSGDWFYKAVLWAVEKGITLGTDKTHFSPDSTCTRAQVVTFLFRDMA